VKRRSRDKSRPQAKPAPPPDRPQDIQGRWAVGVLAALTWLLTLPVFEPNSWGLFAGVAFIPWTVAVCLAARARWLYFVSYLLGTAFFLWHFRWLYTTTGAGYFAASLYLAVYFPLAAWPVRHLYRNRKLSPAITLPIAWVAWELIRSQGPLGFPWFLAGHTQVRRLVLIQIADIAGAFGVSFVVMMVNGWLAERLLRAIQIRRGKKPSESPIAPALTAIALLVVVGGTVLYGRYRLNYHGAQPGPRVAVLQGDYLLSAEDDLNTGPQHNKRPDDDDIDRLLRDNLVGGDCEADKRLTYLKLIEECTGKSPDLMVLPETPWSLYLNRELRELPAASDYDRMDRREKWEYNFRKMSKLQHEQFQGLAAGHKSYIVIGTLSHEPPPGGLYPAQHRYNSAFVYPPDGRSEPLRYDKIHLVVFGEYVPFRDTPRLRWLYRFLNDSWFNPWGRGGYEYSLTAGRTHTTFPIRARSTGDKEVHFGVTICYEDVMPQIFRKFITDEQGRKRVDFMVNISNDGWFGHGNQQAQHLANCAFRAVENRVSVARAANTGVSGFIYPNGSWYHLVGDSSTEPRVGGTGCSVAEVEIDPRVTIYSRHGDVFALVCVVLALAGTMDSLFFRRLRGTGSSA